MSPGVPKNVKIDGWAAASARTIKTVTTRYIPWGSQLARMSAFLGIIESFIVNRGSPLQALLGGLTSYTSVVGANILNVWSDLPPERGGPARALKPLVKKLASSGEIVPAMKSSPLLAGVLNAVLGAVQGMFGKTDTETRWHKVWTHAVKGGIQGVSVTYMGDLVLEMGVEVDRRTRRVVRPLVEQWKPGGPPIDLVIARQKLPSPLIHDEHTQLLGGLEGQHARRLAHLENLIREGHEKLYRDAGVEFTEPTHRLWLTSPDSDYKTDEKNRVAKYTFDIKGESIVRLQHDELKFPGQQGWTELRLLTARAFGRAENSGNAIQTREDDQGIQHLFLKSGFREWELRTSGKSTPEEEEKLSFDAAVTDVLARLTIGLEADSNFQVAVEEGKQVKGPILGQIYKSYPLHEQQELIRALLIGKKQMTLEPLVRFFAPDGCTPEEHRKIESEIIGVDKGSLLLRRPPDLLRVHSTPAVSSEDSASVG